jgi:hypothetical protein
MKVVMLDGYGNEKYGYAGSITFEETSEVIRRALFGVLLMSHPNTDHFDPEYDSQKGIRTIDVSESGVSFVTVRIETWEDRRKDERRASSVPEAIGDRSDKGDAYCI